MWTRGTDPGTRRVLGCGRIRTGPSRGLRGGSKDKGQLSIKSGGASLGVPCKGAHESLIQMPLGRDLEREARQFQHSEIQKSLGILSSQPLGTPLPNL